MSAVEAGVRLAIGFLDTFKSVAQASGLRSVSERQNPGEVDSHACALMQWKVHRFRWFAVA